MTGRAAVIDHLPVWAQVVVLVVAALLLGAGIAAPEGDGRLE